MTGADIEAAIADASPQVNPRLSEVDWDVVAAALGPSTASEECCQFACYEDEGCMCAGCAPSTASEPETGLDVAWAAAEAALPDGWVPFTLGPSEDWAVGDVESDDPTWIAGTCTLAFFNGETDADDQMASGSGPTPAAALRALAAALASEPVR